MRSASLFLCSLLVGLLVPGCAAPETQATVGVLGTEPSPPEVRGPVKTDREEAKAAVKTLRDYAFTQKGEFVAEMNQELKAIQVAMARLAVKADEATGTAKTEAKVALEKVRVQWALVTKQLVEAEKAPEHRWQDSKVGFRKAYDELQVAVSGSRRWLSEKIEP